MKKLLSPKAKRNAAKHVKECFGVSKSHSCLLVGISRMTCRYSAVERDDSLLREKIKELANKHKRYGSPRIQVLLRKEGFAVNHKKTERIYKEENLSLRTKKKKKLPLKERTKMVPATRVNEVWSIDFMSDSLTRGSRYRILSVMADYSRFSPGTEVSFSIPSQMVIRFLENMASINGYLKRIRLDKGPEFTSKASTSWALTRGIQFDYTRPGKPTDNCYIESFNGKLRDECLNENWFMNIQEARETIRTWLTDYNHKQPHSFLGNCSPYEFVMNQNNMLNNQIIALKVA